MDGEQLQLEAEQTSVAMDGSGLEHLAMTAALEQQNMQTEV